MTILGLSEYLQLHPATIRKKIRSGELKYEYRIMRSQTSDGLKGRRHLWFEPEWVEEYLGRFK